MDSSGSKTLQSIDSEYNNNNEESKQNNEQPSMQLHHQVNPQDVMENQFFKEMLERKKEEEHEKKDMAFVLAEFHHRVNPQDLMANKYYKEMLERKKEEEHEKKDLAFVLAEAKNQTSPFFKRQAQRMQKMKTPITKKPSGSRSTPYSTAKKNDREKNERGSKPSINRSLLIDFQTLSLSDPKI